MNTYKDLNIPPLSENLVSKLLDYSQDLISQNAPTIYLYTKPVGNYLKDNKEKLANATVYFLSKTLNNDIVKFYKDYELIKNVTFYIQIIADGNYLAPHIDDLKTRKTANLFTLQTGGNNVETVWWNLKKEYQEDFGIDHDLLFFPYYKLEKSHSHILPYKKWCQISIDTIHSIENMTESRISFTFIEKK
jgi:hypothetical protein